MKTESFPQRVYKLTSLIPKGLVSTYSVISKALNNPKAARAVGNALNKILMRRKFLAIALSGLMAKLVVLLMEQIKRLLS
jgi:alkylated DNA nucleotide flippase Atl1